MSSNREIEDELKRILMSSVPAGASADRPVAKEAADGRPTRRREDDRRDVGEGGKKIRKRRGKRRERKPTDESDKEGKTGGDLRRTHGKAMGEGHKSIAKQVVAMVTESNIGGNNINKRSGTKSKNNARIKVSDDDGEENVGGGHPPYGLTPPCRQDCPLCRFPGQRLHEASRHWTTEEKKTWRQQCRERRKLKNQETKGKKVKKREAAKKARGVETEKKGTFSEPTAAPATGAAAVSATSEKTVLSQSNGEESLDSGEVAAKPSFVAAVKEDQRNALKTGAGISRQLEKPKKSQIALTHNELLNIFGKPDLIPSDAIFEDLENDGIFLLRKKNSRFPRAKFFCRTCDYHLDNVGFCFRHIHEDRHLRIKQAKEQDFLLRHLPSASPAQVEVINETLERIVERVALKEEDVKHRKFAVKKLETIITEDGKIPPELVSLVIYGSTITGFGLVTSDVNVDVRIHPAKASSKSETISSSSWSAARIVLKIGEILDEMDFYQDVRKDFQSKIPCIYATDISDAKSPIRLAISTGNLLSCETAKLLEAYSKIDSRATKLAILFRYLGQLLEIDQPWRGTLPSYSLILMVIYFCQTSPIPLLPVLQSLYPVNSNVQPERLVEGRNCYFFDDLANLDEVWISKSPFNLGALWLSLLRFYSCEFEANRYVVSIRQVALLKREDKKWTAKRVALEDPFNHKRNLAHSVPSSVTFDYISERLRNAFLYFAVPQLKSSGGPAFDYITPRVAQWICRCRTLLDKFAGRCSKEASEATLRRLRDRYRADAEQFVERKNDVGEASIAEKSIPLATEAQERETIEGDKAFDNFVDLLTNLVMEDAVEEVKAVLKRKPTFVPRLDKKAVQEIMAYGTEMANSVIREVLTSLRNERVEATAETTDDTETGNHSSRDSSSKDSAESLVGGNGDDDEEDDDDSASSSATENSSEENSSEHAEEENTIQSLEPLKPLFEDKLKLESNAVSKHPDEFFLRQLHEPVCDRCRELRTLLLEPHTSDEDLESSALEYFFDKETLGDRKGPPVVCSLCLKDGHFKDCCPDDELPDLVTLPLLTAQHRDLLDSLCERVPTEFAPKDSEVQLRTTILSELETFIREDFKDAKLVLFGSSVNGFGFRKSDMDICMTLGDGEVKGLTDDDLRELIEHLAKKLRPHPSIVNVFAIVTAKVPIVKFTHVKGREKGAPRIDGDISLYNTLAIHNTRMLAFYADFDPRVKILGYVMKVFAKLCHIGDASKGSLSSYAYVILVLYFLQQRSPPVIPCLQEIDHLDENGIKKETIVDGWNAWYFQGTREDVKKFWPEWGKNQETVGQLWLGLLRFYTEDFRIKDRVVTIRQLAPLSRLEKMWTGVCIAIEDPFELSHNLGGGLSRKMNSFILKAFIKGRSLFGTPIAKLPAECASFSDYFFDPKRLTEGKPPTDRGCHICGKIGHYVRDCPVDKANKEKRAEREMRRRKSSGNESGTGNDQSARTNNKDQNRHLSETDGDVKRRISLPDGRTQRKVTPPQAQVPVQVTPHIGDSRQIFSLNAIGPLKNPAPLLGDAQLGPRTVNILPSKLYVHGSSPDSKPVPRSESLVDATSPSSLRLGQSLDMKELFAMAGGSPVSLGSIPGSVKTTPSPRGRISSSSAVQDFISPPSLSSPSKSPRKSLAQHISHIGSLSSNYAMQTRETMFDAPLLAPPNVHVDASLDFSVPSSFRGKDPQPPQLPQPPQYRRATSSAAHTFRSLDEVTMDTGAAVGLDPSEMSVREILASKINPLPKSHTPAEGGQHAAFDPPWAPPKNSTMMNAPTLPSLHGVNPLSSIWSPLPENRSWTPEMYQAVADDRRRYSREDLMHIRSFSPRAPTGHAEDAFGLGNLFLPLSTDPLSAASSAELPFATPMGQSQSFPSFQQPASGRGLQRPTGHQPPPEPEANASVLRHTIVSGQESVVSDSTRPRQAQLSLTDDVKSALKSTVLSERDSATLDLRESGNVTSAVRRVEEPPAGNAGHMAIGPRPLLNESSLPGVGIRLPFNPHFSNPGPHPPPPGF